MDVTQLLPGHSNYYYWYGVLALLTAVFALPLYRQFRKPEQLPFPVIAVDKSLGDSDVFDAIRRGTKTYPTRPFTLVDPPLTIVILPELAINDLKDVSTDVASFRNFLYVYWQGKYSYIGQYSHATEAAVKTGLNRDINAQLSTLVDEANFAVGKMIGPKKEWEGVHLSSTFTRIVAYMTFRSFVGLPLSREDAWIQATTQYAMTLEKFSGGVRSWPSLLQWFVAPVYWYRSVRPHQQQFIDMLSPIVHAAKKARQDKERGLPAEPPTTLIEWMVSYNKMKDVSPTKITGGQLTASFAALHSTTALVEHVILDLAARPEYITALREELDQHAPDGNFDKVVVSKLWKLDSFIRESQRCNPATAFHMLRLAASRLTLRDWVLPSGTMFAVSAAATGSIKSYDNRDDFDGFRYARMRAQPGNETRYQLVTTGPDATSFGHGPHACPGRYFASNEIKVLVAHLIRTYDIKLQDGEKRPRNLLLPGGAVFPDPQARIMFKDRAK